MSVNQKIRIHLCSYDHKLLEDSVEKIVQTVKRTGANINGPVPLPNKYKKFTVLRSPHVNKDARVQFQLVTHKRVIDILPTEDTVKSLMLLDLAAGVDVNINIES